MSEEETGQILDQGGMSVSEAAKFTCLSRSFLYKLMANGDLAYVQVGRKRIIPRVALIRLLSQHLIHPAK